MRVRAHAGTACSRAIPPSSQNVRAARLPAPRAQGTRCGRCADGHSGGLGPSLPRCRHVRHGTCGAGLRQPYHRAIAASVVSCLRMGEGKGGMTTCSAGRDAMTTLDTLFCAVRAAALPRTCASTLARARASSPGIRAAGVGGCERECRYKGVQGRRGAGIRCSRGTSAGRGRTGEVCDGTGNKARYESAEGPGADESVGRVRCEGAVAMESASPSKKKKRRGSPPAADSCLRGHKGCTGVAPHQRAHGATPEGPVGVCWPRARWIAGAMRQGGGAGLLACSSTAGSGRRGWASEIAAAFDRIRKASKKRWRTRMAQVRSDACVDRRVVLRQASVISAGSIA